jgi:lipid-A-disaccharide synthase
VSRRLTVAVVAGEPSGDMLGAALIRALRQRHSNLEFVGIAGPRMMAEGARTLYPMERLSVSGYVEVLKRVPEIISIMRGVSKTLIGMRPDLFIGIDAPDFNFGPSWLPGVEPRLKRAGIPTVHYVSPSIWAWRANRIHGIRRAVDRMLVVFPFEQAIYEKAGIPATYVGHPLADAIPLTPDRDEARIQLRLPTAATPVALLPGSRMSELRRHSDLLIDTALELAAKRPELRFFVPLATRETRDYFESRLYAREANHLPIELLFGHARLALQAAEAAIVASGTATLEAALARCPMVITYRLNPLTYRLMKRQQLQPWVGLPNVLAGEFVVPELIQEDATPANLAQALGNLLDSKAARDLVRERFARMHASLACGHDARLVEALEPYLNPDSPSDHAAPLPETNRPHAAVRG